MIAIAQPAFCMSLSHAFDPKRNSLDFLRFVLAAFVLITHSFDLTGAGHDPLAQLTHFQESFARLAVGGFFALSGFLIARSHANTSSVWRFLWRRALRILPGFWVCLIITVLVFAPTIYWIENGSLSGFLTMPGPGLASYVFNNLSTRIDQHTIGTLLRSAPFSNAINGSLWTLYNELRCYLLIAVLGLFGATHARRWLFPLMLVALYALHMTYNALGGEEVVAGLPLLRPTFVSQLCYFFAGATLWAYAERVPTQWPVAAAVAALLCATAIGGVLYRWFDVLAWPYLLLWLGTRLPITRWAARGDFSYGLYIYAFPIQQILVILGVAAFGLSALIGASFGVTLLFAVISHYAVEAPALRLKDAFSGAHKRASSQAPSGL
jgi:peptidoglycan/LPS O-acetylase OafA/YrhL